MLGIGAIFIFAAFIGNKNSPTAKRKEREDEIKKTPADAVVDGLDNSNDVRGTIDQGRNRFADTVRQLLLRAGTSIANLVNRRKR